LENIIEQFGDLHIYIINIRGSLSHSQRVERERERDYVYVYVILDIIDKVRRERERDFGTYY